MHKVAKIPGQLGATWVEERPGYMGGTWGIGCRICAWYMATGRLVSSEPPSKGASSKEKKALAQKPRKALPIKFAKGLLYNQARVRQPGATQKHQWQKENGSNPRFNKLARFELRGPMAKHMLLQRLRAHGSWECHKEALRAFFIDGQKGPPLPPGGPTGVAQGLSRGCADGNPKHELAKRLLAGRVPTAEDWRDALIECEEGIALRSATRMACKRKADRMGEAALKLNFDRATGNKRKVRRKQYTVMAEVVRSEAREALREATSCSLALDGSAGRKVVRFRCDSPRHPWFKDGVIGLLDENAFKNLEEFGADHADRAALKFDELLSRFCTPLAAGLDHQDLKDHILKIVHVISADGCAAERRAMHLAAERAFENLIDLIRDPAHAIRIMMQALRKDDFFKEMWDELFENKHSLVPSWGLPVRIGSWFNSCCGPWGVG